MKQRQISVGWRFARVFSIFFRYLKTQKKRSKIVIHLNGTFGLWVQIRFESNRNDKMEKKTPNRNKTRIKLFPLQMVFHVHEKKKSSERETKIWQREKNEYRPMRMKRAKSREKNTEKRKFLESKILFSEVYSILFYFLFFFYSFVGWFFSHFVCSFVVIFMLFSRLTMGAILVLHSLFVFAFYWFSHETGFFFSLILFYIFSFFAAKRTFGRVLFFGQINYT